MAKCPQCGKEVQPNKTWKMAGRPDKTGKRTELTIGLCECCGKTFRTTLGKKKIQSSGKIDPSSLFFPIEDWILVPKR